MLYRCHEVQGVNIQQFAEQHGLRVTRDECGDPIIEGRRGHLYFDGNALCLMALDGQLRGFNNQQVQSLGGNCWIGDIWRGLRGKGYRDVWVKAIPMDNAKQAIRLLKIPTVRKLTAEQKAIAVANLKPFTPWLESK